jgi:hypothetical protein
VTTARPAGVSSGRADRKIQRATLEAVGADVGQVVGDHVQACLLGIEAGAAIQRERIIQVSSSVHREYLAGLERALASAVCSILICISNCRARLIMLTIASTAIDVAAFQRLGASLTFSSASAGGHSSGGTARRHRAPDPSPAD